MQSKLWFVVAAMLACLGLTACGPALVGAGGVIVADEVAEDRGGNLF